MAIAIPPDAECCMIPVKWLPVLQQIAHGPFLPIDFPIPIVVSKMVPDDEIWFCKTSNIISTDGDIEVIKKEKTSEDMFKPISNSSDDQQSKQLCVQAESSDKPANGGYSVSGPVLGPSDLKSPQDSDN